jgi:hypothetical protein
MKKMKTIFMAVIMIVCSSQLAYANVLEKDIKLPEQVIQVLDKDAIREGRTVVIDLGGGAKATFSPISKEVINPHLNVTKTLALTNTSWYFLTSDTPLFSPEVTVVNYSTNPGNLDVRVRTSYLIDNIHYDWALELGWQVTFTGLGFPNSYDVYVSANAVNGNYKVTAHD